MTSNPTIPPLPPYELAEQVRKARYFLFEDQSNPKGEVSIVFGGLEYCHEYYLIDRKTYPFYCLEIILEGSGQVDLGTQTYALHPGSIFLHGAELPCKIVTDSKAPLIKHFITFESSRSDLPSAFGLDPVRFFQSAASDGLIPLAEMLFQEGIRNRQESLPICNHFLGILLLRLKHLLSLDARRNERGWEVFQQIRDTIDRRFLEFHTLGELASTVGLNVSYISRLFQRYHHTTPYKYLQHRKIEYAIDLLRNKGRTVAEAAALTGFEDPFHFSRVFKKIKGFSPVHFRQRD